MRLDIHGLITSDVAFWCGIFSTWRPSGNRVSKTRFINQKNLKKIWSLMYQPKYPKTNFRNPRNTTIPILETQIRGRERESSPHQRTAWAHTAWVLLWVLIWWFLGVAWILLWWVLLWWVACGLGFFFFFPLGSSLKFWVSFYKGYKSSLRDSIFMRSPHGKNATSDMIRPWKSSLWYSIYRPKSSLIDSRC